MVKPAPASAFVMTESEFLLEFLVIPFDDPALFGKGHHLLQLCTGRQSGKPVLRGFCFPLRPFNQQPLFRMWFGFPVITMCRADTQRSESGLEFVPRTLSPRDSLPRL